MYGTRIHRLLFCTSKLFYCTNVTTKSAENIVKRSIIQKIKTTGPIPIADYMKEALTNAASGYYTTKDVIGKEGDFITSPEISQMFGEMIGVWLCNEYIKLKKPKPYNIVELGPGRGTMMRDILRVFNRFKCDSELTVYLFEVSEVLARIQAEKLGVTIDENDGSNGTHYMKGKTANNINVFWYKNFRDKVVRGFSFYVAHEYFDALPIHKFQKTEKGWCEVLIDLDHDNGVNDKLRYVLSPGKTPVSAVFIDKDEKRTELEVCPEAISIMESLADRLVRYGGMTLVIDYGHEGTKTDTFRAFNNHQQCDPLQNAGNCDLTADVDFSALKRVTQPKLIALGPVTQQQFLKQLGMEVRLEELKKKANDEQKETLDTNYHMLVDDDKMGTCFHVLAFLPSVLEDIVKEVPPSGFMENKKLDS